MGSENPEVCPEASQTFGCLNIPESKP